MTKVIFQFIFKNFGPMIGHCLTFGTEHGFHPVCTDHYQGIDGIIMFECPTFLGETGPLIKETGRNITFSPEMFAVFPNDILIDDQAVLIHKRLQGVDDPTFLLGIVPDLIPEHRAMPPAAIEAHTGDLLGYLRRS